VSFRHVAISLYIYITYHSAAEKKTREQIASCKDTKHRIQKTNHGKPTSAASTRINVTFIGLLVVTTNRIRP